MRPKSYFDTFVPYRFNPRTHVGCDIINLLQSEPTRFQSTHPRRVRPTPITQFSLTFMFQSTHPRRVRPSFDDAAQVFFEFQSTHPRRVRRRDVHQSFYPLTFQSTHPRRVRLPKVWYNRGFGMFQSTHPRRVRRSIERSSRHTNGFNPRTHVGCDKGDPQSYH
mgnify:CR=1 FL=1